MLPAIYRLRAQRGQARTHDEDDLFDIEAVQRGAECLHLPMVMQVPGCFLGCFTPRKTHGYPMRWQAFFHTVAIRNSPGYLGRRAGKS